MKKYCRLCYNMITKHDMDLGVEDIHACERCAMDHPWSLDESMRVTQ